MEATTALLIALQHSPFCSAFNRVRVGVASGDRGCGRNLNSGCWVNQRQLYTQQPELSIAPRLSMTTHAIHIHSCWSHTWTSETPLQRLLRLQLYPGLCSLLHTLPSNLSSAHRAFLAWTIATQRTRCVSLSGPLLLTHVCNAHR
jgi:hypothetical protein